MNPKIVYTTRETLFYKLDRFGNNYNDQQHLTKNLTMFEI